jgi:hypothetical protein
VDYPASRYDLVNYARRECEGGNYPQGECERVLEVLSQLPDREYQRPVDVSKAGRSPEGCPLSRACADGFQVPC